jgi:N-acetylglucosamine-6-phosphate deacetylase
VVPRGTLIIDGRRIKAIESHAGAHDSATRVDVSGCVIVPGFIDVHVHGVEGHDVLDGSDAVAAVAARLPRYGVTAFCPTSIACDPTALAHMLDGVTRSAAHADGGAARVLPAHLESNFINPEYKGAQPQVCLRQPPGFKQQASDSRTVASGSRPHAPLGEFTGHDIVDTIATHREAVGIVTVAPELEGGLDLVRTLAAAGHIVSVGHSGATYEQTCGAIAAGVRHATHLFNRMSPLTHRAPGVVGAVLQSDRVTAELICDGFHVHHAAIQFAIRAKGVDRIMAITDGTAGSGLPVGARTQLGGRPIIVTERTAELEDGTLAGSVLTMDGAFRALVQQVGLGFVEAARLCATTPARQLGLRDTGRIEAGALADLTVLDGELRVRQTYIAGTPWGNPAPRQLV